MTIQTAEITRDYLDPRTGQSTVIGVTVAYPARANMAGLLMELGSAMVDMVDKLTNSPEAKPITVADIGVSDSLGTDLLIRELLGRPSEKKDKLNSEKGDDDTHGS